MTFPGSPPRVRGKVQILRASPHTPWITPACAGKSSSCRQLAKVPVGSPPRVRGKGISWARVSVLDGITPACAGKRITGNSPALSMQDHPRVCGEKFSHCSTFAFQPGSPPRVRGKVARTLVLVLAIGITPACAGKRLKRSRSTVPHAAIVPLFPSVCNKPAGSDGSPAGHDAPPFLPLENAVPASPAYNLRSL